MNKIINVIGRGDTENSSKKIEKIRLKVKVKDVSVGFNITDIMLQTGDKAGAWNSHPSEIRWAFNE